MSEENTKRTDFVSGEPVSQLLYGENGWQSPAFLFRDTGLPEDPLAIHNFQALVGAPSYNNMGDIDRLLQTITHIAAAYDLNQSAVPNIAVAVKHGNACGAAVSHDPAEAIKSMINGDLRAIMGGLVMTNFPIDKDLAELLLFWSTPFKGERQTERQRRLLDGVIAPLITPEAVDIMKRKADKCRLLVNSALVDMGFGTLDQAPLRRQVRGGWLVQPNYTYVIELFKAASLIPGAAKPDIPETKFNDLLLAWAICATSTSNTITIVKDGMLLGNGVGQQDRVGAAKLAIDRAVMSNHGEHMRGAVAASDSFFPFPDGVVTLAEAGIKTILATSGSVNDEKVGNCATELGVTLIALPDKESRGFYNH